MLLLEQTLASPALNVALDEALLTWAGEQPEDADREVLRLWESPTPAVVIGRSTKVAEEVYVEQCRKDGIPVLRRCSGGAAVVIGPGCLMYAVLLDLKRSPHLEMINAAHAHVTGQLAASVRQLEQSVDVRGHCDLTINNLKFSGNALRVTKSHVLYHGTILYDFDLGLIFEYLREPPRRPDYRQQRTHEDFVRNLDVEAAKLKKALANQWDATVVLENWPQQLTHDLREQKYGREDWNFRR